MNFINEITELFHDLTSHPLRTTLQLILLALALCARLVIKRLLHINYVTSLSCLQCRGITLLTSKSASRNTMDTRRVGLIDSAINTVQSMTSAFMEYMIRI